MGRDEGRSSPPPLLPTGSPLPPAVRLARDGHTRSAAGMAKEKETQGSRKLKKKKKQQLRLRETGGHGGRCSPAARLPHPFAAGPSPAAPQRPSAAGRAAMSGRLGRPPGWGRGSPFPWLSAPSFRLQLGFEPKMGWGGRKRCLLLWAVGEGSVRGVKQC